MNANKIYLNIEKTELFITKEKTLDGDNEINLGRKQLYPSQSIKYLCIKIDRNLNWKDHVNDIAVKLNRAGALLFKIKSFKNFININT